jgi:branched-subunit amino acid permease
MENEKFLSEERYQKNNQKIKKIGKKLLIAGIIVLVVGFIFTVLGVLGFGNTAINAFDDTDTINEASKGIFGSFGLLAIGGLFDSVGSTLTLAGAITMIVAHRREITAYATQQIMPIAQEGIEKITPTISNAAGSIAKNISKGIKEGKEDTQDK